MKKKDKKTNGIVKEIADILDGIEYDAEISEQDIQYAKENGAVIVFGASDDLMEIRGAIYDEVGCFAGGNAYFDKTGLLVNECENEDCPYFREMKSDAKVVTAVFDSEGYSWVYKTDIPHEAFEILKDGMKYCRGIVFWTGDLK